MPYITREDGERFIIPSYRDVLSAKKPALLKKEVTLLSTNYGEYITLQRKNVDQYEAAFSPDAGYLLGETVWHQFKRPKDLIYCEAIPNTSEAILVIVKNGSVYLDGSFPIDSIPDELIVFRTQQNNFEIYIHGDIPLSEQPEEGKFSLDASSVKSFTELHEPIFQTLPTLKIFQLRLVDVVLKSQGIGTLPIKKIIGAAVLIGLVWMAVMYLATTKEQLPAAFISVVNPDQLYVNTLMAPAPDDEIKALTANIAKLYTIPGWFPGNIEYAGQMLKTSVQSSGVKAEMLFDWAAANGAKVQIQSDGVYVNQNINVNSRGQIKTISPLQQVIAAVLDRISNVIPGNNLTLGPVLDRGRFSETQLTIAFSGMSLDAMNVLADQFKGLPLVLTKVTLSVNNGVYSGTIIIKALGN